MDGSKENLHDNREDQVKGNCLMRITGQNEAYNGSRSLILGTSDQARYLKKNNYEKIR